ncbi:MULTISPECIES: MSMEG_1061 family FMN-dependent PPOX-type flavoprotein [Streptomyces]|uniref:MSMEG_1061 family FMN-dependent PPOX-type flavoprotein n=1 Tax=Streptomyces TaxID=1883 RepID=UPI0005BC9266|nr:MULTISPECIES: MSMEG_1061 family FMN-dependent PPOX-type flavoprotein [Streptomyces]MDP9952387.1 PPOX class probable FMN-dependent enzyme [Streptomyces sp. DSM 41269]
MSHAAEPTAPAADPLAGTVPLGSAEELRELLGTPHPIVIDKVHDRLTDDDVAMLARSPFCTMATSDADGNCDATPRGDAPGFTHVLDRSTIALPDRPGNRRADSFHNILANPRVGLLYLIPGAMDVLRVNGRAHIVTDGPFFDAMTVKGQRPKLALIVRIEEIYRHCPASLKRSGVWAPETWTGAEGRITGE